MPKWKPQEILCQFKKTGYLIIIIAILTFSVSSPVAGQELCILGGGVNSSGETSYAWQIDYMEGLSEHFAYSISWLNEGHLTGHHRDGPTFQLWTRINMLDRRLSLAAGIGPYLYFDTQDTQGLQDFQYKDIHQGLGAIGSLALTWYTESRWLFQLRGNYVLAESDINTTSIVMGIGYQLDAPSTPGPRTKATAQPGKTTNNEIAVFVGSAVVTNDGPDQAVAGGIEYRRGIFRYLDWTIGWLYEGDSELLCRNGISTQIWPTRAFLGNRLTLGIGLGIYVALDTRHNPRPGEDEASRLAGIITPTVSYRFGESWLVRFSWSRTVTNYNRDTDVMLVGIGYRF
jgi:hypothetical protein